MITIVAKSIVKEGKLEEFKVLTKEMIEKSRKEEGCLSYNLYHDVHNDHILTFIEDWKDMETIDLHNASEHFTRIVPQMKALREPGSEVNLYQSIS